MTEQSNEIVKAAYKITNVGDAAAQHLQLALFKNNKKDPNERD